MKFRSTFNFNGSVQDQDSFADDLVKVQESAEFLPNLPKHVMSKTAANFNKLDVPAQSADR